jgi:hypothetical protein
LILPAIKLASANQGNTNKIPAVIKWALAYMIFVAILKVCVINYFPGTLYPQKQALKTGEGDFTLDSYGWGEAEIKFDSLYKKDIAKKIMPADAQIIVTNWLPAANIEFYIAEKTGQQVIGLGEISDLHQYYWTNKYKKKLKTGDDAYFIVPSEAFNFRTLAEVDKVFKYHEIPLTLTQYRSGLICRYLTVYRMRSYLKN